MLSHRMLHRAVTLALALALPYGPHAGVPLDQYCDRFTAIAG